MVEKREIRQNREIYNQAMEIKKICNRCKRMAGRMRQWEMDDEATDEEKGKA